MDVWCGAQPSADELRRATGADIVYFEDEYDKALDAVCALEGQTIFVPSHDAASLPDDPEGLFLGLRAETTALEKVMARCRAIKSSEEIECLRLANRVSADAHVAMWRHAARAAATSSSTNSRRFSRPRRCAAAQTPRVSVHRRRRA